jgi:hypothetical protein
MDYLSHVFVVLSAMVGTLAAPTSLEEADFVPTNLTNLVRR